VNEEIEFVKEESAHLVLNVNCFLNHSPENYYSLRVVYCKRSDGFDTVHLLFFCFKLQK